MKLIKELNRMYTYAEIASRILARTGRRYNPNHLANVANGSRPLTDGLRYNLMQAFPDIFLQHESPAGVKIEPIGETETPAGVRQ
jgi:hypothetical protein